ncbi:hypothetical protein DCAR_0933647 [Daucus carota subsp. sativus]|uniref:Uncharacterized protein n=1 Tax=Daucus carota subsp. sativus TaxID=79200 RepID=A0A175YDC6_DAUCS|nr:hypothetical protein DCAR_0933647 [Daucus carota subsp. sativus]
MLSFTCKSTVSATAMMNSSGSPQASVEHLLTNDSFRHVMVGAIPFLTRLANQLWAIYAPLSRAIIKGYASVILETDNWEAFRTVRDFLMGAPAAVYDLVSQIDILLKDRSWTCVIAYVLGSIIQISRMWCFLTRPKIL